MTFIKSTASTLLVPIDISKHRHEVLIGTPDKKRRRCLTITSTLAGFERRLGVLLRSCMPSTSTS